MSVVDVSKIIEMATNMVSEAKKAGTLRQLTPRIVRKELEKALSLEVGTLDSVEYKAAAKLGVQTGLDRLELEKLKAETDAAVEASNLITGVELGDPNGIASNEQEDEGQGKPQKPAGPKKARSKRITSATTIESSGDEADPNPSKKSLHAKPNPKVTKRKHKAPDAEQPPKKRPKKVVVASDVQDGPSRLSDSESKPESESRNGQSRASDGQGPAAAGEIIPTTDDNGDKSESELSVLIDEAPKKERKKKGSNESKTKVIKNKKDKKKPDTGLSKDEEIIKRLKSFVSACGVRKTWSKEFQGLDKPSQQIKRLREILEELGMTGRPSLGQAKIIKDKRELAKELEEVCEFEQKTLGRAAKKRESDEGPSRLEEGDESESEQGGRRKQRNAARMSIMAFLGDDSDDE